ncbi:MAG: copper transporter [Acidimicrobiales bacterium]
MINLRYHIVSITAVFLALGIGVTLGSTMIQRYTIDTLEGRLDELDDEVSRTDEENATLRGELDERDELADELTEQGRVLFGGHLSEVPVLMLSVQGTSDDLVDQASASLQASGAEVSGTLVFTTRWEDLSSEEIAELSEVVDRQLSTATAARALVLRELADELVDAAGPVPEPDGSAGDPGDDPGATPDGDTPGPDQSGDGTSDDAAQDPEATTTTSAGELDEQPPAAEGPEDPAEEPVPATPEAQILESLLELGYLEFFPEREASAVPAFEMRYVLVVGDEASLPADRVVLPVLEAMSPSGPAPMVVASHLAGEPPLTSDDDSGESDGTAEVIDAIRSDEDLRERISTVDAIGTFVGDAGLVLATADLELGLVQHVGLGPDADRLLPVGAP